VNKRGYVLWLSSWYPSQLEPYTGDFIQRHAKAAAIYTNISVVHVLRDPSGTVTKDYKEERFINGNLHETIVYYYIRPRKMKWVERWISHRKYVALYKRAIEKRIREEGVPKLIQVYVVLKAGIVARKISRKLRIPFVVAEQSTIYLPEARPQFNDFPLYLRAACKKVLREAKAVMVVSDYLGKCLQKLVAIQQPVLIPNVVDTAIFHLTSNEKEGDKPVEFIHISTLGYQKNPEAIFQAFSLVKEKGYSFLFHVVGPAKNELVELSNQLGLRNNVVFHNEMPQQALSKLMTTSDALILYSRYETFGCVLIEANACGVPVIVNDIEVMHENVRAGFNGLFAENENFRNLADQIIYYIESKDSFQREKIAAYAIENYSYDRIGILFRNWYQSL
jgi:glycosyltransferase involved in cell wall biosynthesis